MDVREPHDLPARVGRFAVLGRLGAGGMGVVYVAHDDVLDRKVAVKLLHSATRGGVDAHARFVQREAQAMARLSHPNVVQVYEVGEHDGELFVAMELVDGVNLREWLRESARPLRACVDVLVAAGRGLVAAHAAGVVHRDFKPENVIVGADGRARVVDFGLAAPTTSSAELVGSDEGGRTASDSAGASSSLRSTRAGFDSPLTPGGHVLGTPAYMAPEQFLGHTVDARADQFAFCVTAWEALFRQRPFLGPTRAAVFHAVVEGSIAPPASEVAVPASIREALRRGLAAEPDERHPSMDALLAVLARDDARIRRGRMLGAAAAVAVVGAAWLGYASGRESTSLCTDFVEPPHWGDDARVAVRASFAATHSPLADAAADETIAALDQHAAAIVATREAACAATHLRGERSVAELDRIYACLDRDDRRTRALVGVLRAADASIVVHASDAVAELDDPASCIDHLRRDTEPTSTDAQNAGAVTQLRERLATAAALHATGDLVRAQAELEPLLLEARDLAERAPLAEALVLRGRVQRGLGMLAPARATLHEALDVADAAGHDVARLDALLALADLFGDGTRAIESESRAIEQARAVAARIGASAREQAILDALTVDQALRAGRLDEARVAMAALEGRDVGDDFDRVARQAQLARAESRAQDAVVLYDAALAQTRARRGRLHPRTAAAIYNAGVARVDIGDFVGASVLVEDALQIWREIYGAMPSEDLGRAHLALLGCALGIGDLARAREQANAAVETLAVAVGPDHPGRAEALLGLGVVEFTEGRFVDAEASNREAVRILVLALGEGHPQTAIARSNLGETLLALGRFDAAQAELTAALAVLTTTLGADSPDLAFALKGLGIATLAQGRASDAIGYLERAAVLTGTGQPLERLDIDAALAVALFVGPRDFARARAIATTALVDRNNSAAVSRRRSLVAWLPSQREAFTRLGLLAPD
jgi:tetratricopeptide (TPR) repeat protein/predicted Ser/Thr protein kinase